MLSELDDEKMLVRAKEAAIHVHSRNVYDTGADQESGAEATGEQVTQTDSPGIDRAASTVRHLNRNCRHAGRRHRRRRLRRMKRHIGKDTRLSCGRLGFAIGFGDDSGASSRFILFSRGESKELGLFWLLTILLSLGSISMSVTGMDVTSAYRRLIPGPEALGSVLVRRQIMRRLVNVGAALFCVVLLPAAVFAQAGLAGNVKDSSGAVLPGRDHEHRPADRLE
jgi:hypothetical protein